MKNRKKALLALIGIISSFVVGNFALSTPVSAAAKKGSKIETVYQKSLAWAIKSCYSNGSMKSSFVPGDYTDTPMMANMLTDKGINQFTTPVPTLPNEDNPIVVGRTTCGLILGSNLLNKYYGTKIDSVGVAQLASIGYEKSAESNYNKNCIGFQYLDSSGTATNSTYITSKACFKVNKTSGKIEGTLGIEPPAAVEAGIRSPIIPMAVFPASLQFGAMKVDYAGKTWNELVAASRAGFSETGLGLQNVLTNSTTDQSFATYKMIDKSKAANKAIKYFSKGKYTKASKAKFKDKDRLTLYMNYINYILAQDNAVKYREDKCGGKTKKADLLKETGYLYHKSQNKWCVLDGVDTVSGEFAGIKADGKGMTMVSFSTIVKEMQKGKYNNFKTPKLDPSAAEEAEQEEGYDPDEDSEQPTCYNSAETLGWILCPAIEISGNAVEGLYDMIKNSFLEIKASTLMASGGSLHQAWEDFRDYANIIFVVLLAVVILSQLTGIGVSNYGIKKILPRLVMIAILVNLSFVICQLAVDLSNILGEGLEKLFHNFANGVTLTPPTGQMLGPTELGEAAGSIVTRLTSTAGTGILMLGGVAIAASTWEFWLIPLLIFFLGCLIGVLFFAIILGVREAGIIILVALTPVAIVCYALPNTKKVYDKWFKLFSSLLFVYPIAGALMGGGLWASKLMLATGEGKSGLAGFFFAMVAMLMQVVPFFLIPSLVKSSLAVAGNLGAKIAGMGDRLSGAAKSGIRSSDTYKDTQERMAGHRGQRMLNRDARLRARDERSAEFRANHRILGALRHPGGTLRNTQMGQNSRNRRLNRANAAMLAADLGNRDRSKSFAQRQINDFKDDYTNSYDDQGMLDQQDKMEQEAYAALEELHVNPDNLQAKGRFMSVAEQLSKSGPERSGMQRVLDNFAYNHHGDVDENGNAQIGDGLRWASSSWKKTIAGKKDNALGVFNRANEMSQGSINVNKFEKELDEKGNPTGIWINHSHDSATADDIGAGQIGKMDKPELKNIISALRKPNGLEEGAAQSILAAAHEANSNDTISVDGDKQNLVDQIDRLNYTNADANSNGRWQDVNTNAINIMASSNQAGLTRMANYAASGKTKGDELKQLANVAEATLRGANTGKVNLSAEKAEQLNRILVADKRRAIPYSLHVDHNNPTPPPQRVS